MTEPLGILDRLQDALEELHGVAPGARVTDFLVPGAPVDGRAGALLIREGEEGVEVGVRLRPGILEALAEACPFAALDERNLPPFAVALEEVSHFVYFLWLARQDRPVSILELELQGEVDKYACARMLWARQGRRAHGRLLGLLFEDFTWEAGLTPDDARRYETANALAREYCAGLDRRHPGERPRPAFVREIRSFYRAGGREKLRRAQNA